MEPCAVEFPFKCILSLERLIQFWDQALSEGDSVKADFAAKIHEALNKAPELREPIEDLAIIEKHQNLVDMLMCVVFPPAFMDTDYSAAFVPFDSKPFYATKAFKSLLMQDDQDFDCCSNIDRDQWAWGRFMKAYLQILRVYYDIDLTFEYPLVVTAKDPDTGLDRYLKITMDPKFADVKKVGNPKPLSESDKERLLAHIDDPAVWMEIIPPENFEFHGFGVFRAVDVTDQEVLSSLKRDLIEKEAIFSQANF